MSDFMDTSDGKKKVILTYDAPFLNSDFMFIEYDDVIKCPFFVLLKLLQNNKSLNEIMDTSEIDALSLEELYEWYLSRQFKNIFLNLPLRDGIFETYFNDDEDLYIDWTENLLYHELDTLTECVESNCILNFNIILKTIIGSSVVSKIFVYSDKFSESIKDDLIKTYGDKVKYVYGDLTTVLQENKITANSTFVFSDVTKIKILKQLNLLNLASVVIADRYEYNYKNKNDLRVDLEELSKDNVFKLDKFDNINSYE